MTTSDTTNTDGGPVAAALRVLAELLRARGLRVGVSHSTGTLEATNPATEGASADPRYPPQQFHQLVQLAPRDDRLWVWWLWPDQATGSHEREPLLPATDLDEAADKIARVIALAPTEASARS